MEDLGFRVSGLGFVVQKYKSLNRLLQAICQGTSGLTMSMSASTDQGDGSGGHQVCIDQDRPSIGPVGNECEVAPDEAYGEGFVPELQKKFDQRTTPSSV